jgi:hypothetical protein
VDKIRQSFQEYFKSDGVALPDPIPETGTVQKGGWKIQYRLNENGESLDFYAENRRTNSRHIRIHADGKVEPLENYRDNLILEDDSEEAWARASQKNIDNNRNVDRILQEKGFL